MNPRHRVRSLVTPKRDPTADSFAKLLDTHDGKNNPAPRKLPPMDLKQAMQALILATSKEPCYLCEGVPHCVDIYNVPNGLNALGQKLILYTLCFACKADVTSKGKAELRLVRTLQAENVICN